MKRTAFASLALLVLITVLMMVMMHYRDRGRQPRVVAPKPLAPIEGRLSMRSFSDFRVGGKSILLCGVTNRGPAAMQDLLLGAARRAFEGHAVSCVPVGQGTPCDGRVSASFGRSTVVQCHTEDGVDVAAALAEQGILCDLPGQSGGAYKSCGAP